MFDFFMVLDPVFNPLTVKDKISYTEKIDLFMALGPEVGGGTHAPLCNILSPNKLCSVISENPGS